MGGDGGDKSCEEESLEGSAKGKKCLLGFKKKEEGSLEHGEDHGRQEGWWDGGEWGSGQGQGESSECGGIG